MRCGRDWKENRNACAVPGKTLRQRTLRRDASRFCGCRLNGRLIADGHDPLSVALDPQAADMNRLAGVRLVEAGHYHSIAEIKHLRGNERGGRRVVSGLLLQIESGDAVRFAEGMIVTGAEHHEFVGDVRSPSGSV